jgi:hypothetical protein
MGDGQRFVAVVTTARQLKAMAVIVHLGPEGNDGRREGSTAADGKRRTEGGRDGNFMELGDKWHGAGWQNP